MTNLEQKVMDMALTLPIIDENKAFSEICYAIIDQEEESNMDTLSYNTPCFYGGTYHDGEINSHYYMKHVMKVGDYICIRVAMVSSHAELADWDKQSIISEKTQPEIDAMMALDDIDGCERYLHSEIIEVAQVWITPDGHSITLSKDNRFSDKLCHTQERKTDRYHASSNWTEYGECDDDFYDGGWIRESGMSVNTDSDITEVLNSGINEYFYEELATSFVDPEVVESVAFELFKHYIRQYKCHGEFETLFGNIHRLYDTEIAKTLKYWGYTEIFKMYISKALTGCAMNYYHTIKIAHRNGFDASTPERQRRWMELLDNITFCNGNIQDPKNYMPANFDETYEYWQQRKKNKERLIEIELEKERLKQKQLREMSEKERFNILESDYRVARGLMLGIVIGNEDMEIRALQSVAEFVEEGQAQGHCVYTCGYFKFPDMLVFTVRDKKTNNRISTLTYDLQRKEIFANLTKGNAVPLQEKEIEDLFNAHKHLIDRDWARMVEANPSLLVVDKIWKDKQEQERRYWISMAPDREKQRAKNKLILEARAAKAAKRQKAEVIDITASCA